MLSIRQIGARWHVRLRKTDACQAQPHHAALITCVLKQSAFLWGGRLQTRLADGYAAREMPTQSTSLVRLQVEFGKLSLHI